MRIIIFLVSAYLFIGILLLTMMLFKGCQRNNIRFSRMVFDLKLTMTSGKVYEGVKALYYFLFKWPEAFFMVVKYLKD